LPGFSKSDSTHGVLQGGGAPSGSRSFVAILYSELIRTRATVAAAALAFYCMLSLVPLILIFSVILTYLASPHLFQQVLRLTASMVPSEEVAIVEKMVAGAFTSQHRGGALWLGLLGYLWSASGGFSAAIEALDIAYDVEKSRSWWRDRVRAVVLLVTTGSLSLVSFSALIAGPRLGRYLGELLPVSNSFSSVWPAARLILTFATFALAVEILYYLGPNRKQRFVTTFPGALIALTGWAVGSVVLNFYIAHFANYNGTYGPLGTVVILMLWFYIVSLAILIGAESNAELAKLRSPSKQKK
jgi:membrane protein